MSRGRGQTEYGNLARRDVGGVRPEEVVASPWLYLTPAEMRCWRSICQMWDSGEVRLTVRELAVMSRCSVGKAHAAIRYLEGLRLIFRDGGRHRTMRPLRYPGDWPRPAPAAPSGLGIDFA